MHYKVIKYIKSNILLIPTVCLCSLPCQQAANYAHAEPLMQLAGFHNHMHYACILSCCLAAGSSCVVINMSAIYLAVDKIHIWFANTVLGYCRQYLNLRLVRNSSQTGVL